MPQGVSIKAVEILKPGTYWDANGNQVPVKLRPTEKADVLAELAALDDGDPTIELAAGDDGKPVKLNPHQAYRRRLAAAAPLVELGKHRDPGGPALVAVTAAVAGVAGNQPAGLPIALVSPIGGIAAKGVTGEISGGADAESPGQFLARLLARMRRPPHGGNKDDFERWAKEVPGVTRAWPFKSTPRRGITTVLIARDGNPGSPIPTAAEVAAVQAYIERPDIGPICGECVVLAPTAVVHDVTVQLDPNSVEAQAEVTKAIRAFYRNEAAPGVTISHSRLGAAISAAPGEIRHKVTAPSADVGHAAFEMAVLGAIAFEPYGA